MPRRVDPRQLDLPNVPVGVHRRSPDPETRPAPCSRWDSVRYDALVAALLDSKSESVAGLARTADCSPDTIVRTRQGRTPRAALRARLIGIAWGRLDPDTLAAVDLPPDPAENLRWNASTRFAPAHAFRAEPVISVDVVSLCGLRHTDAADRTWPAVPDAHPAICPNCLERSQLR